MVWLITANAQDFTKLTVHQAQFDTGNETLKQMADVASRALLIADGELPRQLLATSNFNVFTTPQDKGFAIVTTDSQCPQLLAYSPTGTFQADTRNPGFLWWQNAVNKLTALHIPLAATTKPDPTLYPDSVPPLLISTWGQHEPYNYQCPMSDKTPWAGYLPQTGHCATGCVATAMAQIMYYYRWPDHGVGSASVTYPAFDSNAHTFTVDFAEATYDWDSMLPSYAEGDYTEAQARAVSQLLYHCGVGSQMVYGSSASGTLNIGANEALEQYFRYDMSQAHLILRTELSEPEWMNLIYQELSNGRPIFYEALDIQLLHGIYGHSFVIDGYDAEGMVHVNWGWDGHENGYFNIALLDPQRYSFDDYQDMTIGIRRPQQEQENNAMTIADPSAKCLFTLDGRVVNTVSPSPGIYIRKGKKVVVPVVMK